MPEDKRIDIGEHLSPEGLALATPLAIEVDELERRWVRDGDEVAYEQWRDALSRLQAVVKEHYIGPATD
jgi:hypothetical protein